MNATENRSRTRRIALALAEALFPAQPGDTSVDHNQLVATAEHYVSHHAMLSRGWHSALWWLEMRFLATRGRGFSKVSPSRRRDFIDAISDSVVGGNMLRAVSIPLKAAFVLDEDRQARAGQRPKVEVPSQVEHFRWQAQISRACDFDDDEELEAEVVVIGTGAGGAAAAYELASRGLAVVLLEEGEYYHRADFTGKLTEVIPKLYRASGATAALGNVIMPVPIGKNVGGSTTINSGTAMRPPSDVLARWRSERGLEGFSAEEMEDWFKSVEEVLCVEYADPKYIGEIGNVIAEGARKLGFTEYHPLPRNARGCDGQGLCQFGCPTDAKQSTNVSYIPRALDRGAFLFTGFKAEQLLHENQRIQGVTARGVGASGKPVTLTLKAPHVIVAAGSFMTPGFLRANGVRNRNLGRHLTVHPAGVVNGWFPDRQFDNSRTIPQGFGVSDLSDEGLVFEGGTIPFHGHGLLNTLYGEEYMRFTERYQETAYFGFMVRDTSEGKVRKGPHPDIPLITYHMNDRDFSLFLKGIELLGKMYLAAGAREVMIPGTRRMTRVRNESELMAFVNARRKPSEFMMTAYHPLGTARIARNAEEGVCDSNHAVFGWQGLYVMDGSSVPTSLGANPQVTIMALAARAAARLAEQIAAQEAA
jgi:choline dehydrogenase-like flavoprotein